MNRLKFRTKLIVISVVVLILQGFFIGYFSYYYARDMVLNNKQRDMIDMINRIDININSNIRYINELIEINANNKSIKSLTTLSSENKDLIFKESFENLNSFIVLENNIILVTNTESFFLKDSDKFFLENPKDSESYKKALANPNKNIWSNVTSSLLKNISDNEFQKNDKTISVSRAIFDESNLNVVGVLIVELTSEALSKIFLNSENTFQNQYTFILDKENNIVCSNKASNEKWINLVSESFEKGKRKFEIELDGNFYKVYGQSNGITGWTTFSVLSKDYIFRQVNPLKNLTLLIVTLSIFSVSLIFIVISYTMTRPLKKLSDAMKTVYEGDFTVQLNTKRKDEFGNLMDSFDFMIEKINTLVKKVYEKQITQKNAEMEALEAEINPHFLYNTLDSINWMLIGKGDFEVSELIVSLGDLMRYTVNKNNGIVELKEEINYIINYLHIQKTRLEDKLNYEIIIPDNLLEFKVPKLILQPIVENAIIHGIEPMKKNGNLIISAKEINNILFIEVKDNGPGMTEDKLKILKQNLKLKSNSFDSIGMYNVNKRIRIHYGDEFNLKVNSVFGEGTKVLMKIPKPK